MSRTDKTDPYSVKVDRYGEHHWKPIFRCSCDWCKDPYTGGKRKREKRQWRKEADADRD